VVFLLNYVGLYGMLVGGSMDLCFFYKFGVLFFDRKLSCLRMGTVVCSVINCTNFFLF